MPHLPDLLEILSTIVGSRTFFLPLLLYVVFEVTLKSLIFRFVIGDIYDSLGLIGPDLCFIGLSLFITAAMDASSEFCKRFTRTDKAVGAALLGFIIFLALYTLAVALYKMMKDRFPHTQLTRESIWSALPFLITNHLIGIFGFYLALTTL